MKRRRQGEMHSFKQHLFILEAQTTSRVIQPPLLSASPPHKVARKRAQQKTSPLRLSSLLTRALSPPRPLPAAPGAVSAVRPHSRFPAAVRRFPPPPP